MRIKWQAEKHPSRVLLRASTSSGVEPTFSEMIAALLSLMLVAAAPLPAPLLEYMQAARVNNRALAISRAQSAQRTAQAQQASAALLPSLRASADYTRNQFEAAAVFSPAPGEPPINVVIVPFDEWLATVGLNVPIVNLTNLERLSAARHGERSAKEALLASVADTDLSVAQAYYQVVAAQGVQTAAARAVATAEANQVIVETQLEAGTATQLAVERTRVDTSRARQNLVAASRTLFLAKRNLATLAGAPEPIELPQPPEPVLPAESEEVYVQRALQRRPEVQQLEEAVAQAEANRRQALSQLAPVISGAAQEHFKNAPGFIGQETYWTVGLGLQWTIDPLSTRASVRLADGVLQEQRARLAQIKDTVRDQVHSALLDIQASHARFREAQAEVRSAREALRIAQLRLREGTAISVELSQAQTDAFRADATLAQAQSDLAYSLLALHRASGEPLLEK
jgi:outer membrane protein TolC